MKKILIVDDIKLLLEQQKNILRCPDCHIITVSSAEDALEIQKKFNADLVIIGLDMKEMPGDTLCTEIRKKRDIKSTSILMVISHDKADIERVKKCGANDYITKPIKAQTLLEKASALLGVSERKPIKSLTKINIEGNSNSFDFFVTSVNLSSTGVLIETELALPISDTVNCSLSLPDKAPVYFQGEVVRAMKKYNSEMYQYGIRFTEISDLDKSMITKYIEDISFSVK